MAWGSQAQHMHACSQITACNAALQVCRNTSHWGPWQAVRGRCSKYRKEQQSCNAYFAAAVPSLAPTGSSLKQHTRKHSSSSSSTAQSALHHLGEGSGGNSATAHKRSLLSPLDAFHAPISSSSSSSSSNTVLEGSHLDQLAPQYVVSDVDGRPPVRPMLCGPGLVCTGDVQPTPYTCVKVRPPNMCYQVGCSQISNG
jgi:hypothetical protein